MTEELPVKMLLLEGVEVPLREGAGAEGDARLLGEPPTCPLRSEGVGAGEEEGSGEGVLVAREVLLGEGEIEGEAGAEADRALLAVP